jgi:hypothetical protein
LPYANGHRIGERGTSRDLLVVKATTSRSLFAKLLTGRIV